MTPEIINVPLDATARLELALMAYNRWADAFEGLKIAKLASWESSGKFCPKTDWPLFKADNIKTAEIELNKAVSVKDQICKYSPLILNN